GGVLASTAAASGPVQAAVRSRHVIEYVDIDLPQEDVAPQIIDVDAGHLPLILNFKSASSRIQVHQTHEGSEPGEIQETESEDEPQLLRHSVTKPIIQEVREIITPFRRIVQEIRPVEEEVKTIVARGRGRTTGDTTAVAAGVTTAKTGSTNTVGTNTGRIGNNRGSYGGSSVGAFGSNSFASKSGYK
ncbi:DFP2-like protein, partial [Euroglyphus maynei]